MSAHHYKLDLLPRAAFLTELPAAVSSAEVDLGEDESTGWWARFPPSEELLADLRALLPLEQSWGQTEEYVSGGEWPCSDLRIWKSEGRVWHVTFRFSPFADAWELMRQFIVLAQRERCVLLEQSSGALLEADERAVMARLASSRAALFMRDPKAAIVEAARDHKPDAA